MPYRPDLTAETDLTADDDIGRHRLARQRRDDGARQGQIGTGVADLDATDKLAAVTLPATGQIARVRFTDFRIDSTTDVHAACRKAATKTPLRARAAALVFVPWVPAPYLPHNRLQ